MQKCKAHPFFREQADRRGMKGLSESIPMDYEAFYHLEKKIETDIHHLENKVEGSIHLLDLKVEDRTHNLELKIEGNTHKLELKIEQSKVDIYKAMFWTSITQLIIILGGVLAIVKWMK